MNGSLLQNENAAFASYAVKKPTVVAAPFIDPNRTPFKSTFRFSGLPVNLSLSEDLKQFNYGY